MAENLANVSTRKPRGKRRGSLFLQLFLVLAFIAVLWFSLQGNVLGRPGVPHRLGSLEQVSKVEGDEALRQVTKLHGVDIALSSAFIAEYSHEGEHVQVWVGKAASSSMAENLLTQMVEGIRKGGSGFGSLQSLTVGGQEVFRVDGPGGKHFFYSSKERVVWLIINASKPEEIVELAIKTF